MLSARSFGRLPSWARTSGSSCSGVISSGTRKAGGRRTKAPSRLSLPCRSGLLADAPSPDGLPRPACAERPGALSRYPPPRVPEVRGPPLLRWSAPRGPPDRNPPPRESPPRESLRESAPRESAPRESAPRESAPRGLLPRESPLRGAKVRGALLRGPQVRGLSLRGPSARGPRGPSPRGAPVRGPLVLGLPLRGLCSSLDQLRVGRS